MTVGEIVNKIIKSINENNAASDTLRTKATLIVLLKDHLSMELYMAMQNKPYRTKLFFCCYGNEDDSAIVIKNSDLGNVLCPCTDLEFTKKMKPGSLDWYWYMKAVPGKMTDIEAEDYIDLICQASIRQKKEAIEAKKDEIKMKEREIEVLSGEMEALKELLRS